MIRLALPISEAVEVRDQLRAKPAEPAWVEVPAAWCYHVERQAPPRGWRASLLASLRPGLFPEAMDALLWDEEIGEDGSWRVWALPARRLEEALGTLNEALWTANRHVRVHPAGIRSEDTLAAFPNLARPGHRLRRIPWKRIRRVALQAGPSLLLAAGLAVAGIRLHASWLRLASQVQQEEARSRTLDQQVREARQSLGVVQRQASRRGVDAPWMSDLDALTRLLPEDTRLVSLRWNQREAEIDLLTPHPEAIRDILEASPEFSQVRLLGTLERQGDLNRLTLHLESEVSR